MKKVVFALIVLLGLMIGCSNPAEPKIYTSPVELRGCVWQSPLVSSDNCYMFFRFEERKIQHYYRASFPGTFTEAYAFNITFAEGNTIRYDTGTGQIVTLIWDLSENHQILTLSFDLIASLNGEWNKWSPDPE
ncbi:MAG: hypothetical protein LBG84_06895 [Treponema sp.]|jgi:hypothetical protein|nr:hypothetical protein [Treponema sp.]